MEKGTNIFRKYNNQLKISSFRIMKEKGKKKACDTQQEILKASIHHNHYTEENLQDGMLAEATVPPNQ